jgi:hypothetical protein
MLNTKTHTEEEFHFNQNQLRASQMQGTVGMHIRKTNMHVFFMLRELNANLEDTKKTQIILIVITSIKYDVKNTLNRIGGRQDFITEKLHEIECLAIKTMK